jgi:hypothetical protein
MSIEDKMRRDYISEIFSITVGKAELEWNFDFTSAGLHVKQLAQHGIRCNPFNPLSE